jgi:hypothetical protein
MPENSRALAQNSAFAVGEEQCRCVDINCHSKSITVPVTVVLGLVVVPGLLRAVPRNPRQMTFCCERERILRLWYMHFGKRQQASTPAGVDLLAAGITQKHIAQVYSETHGLIVE